MSIHIGLPITLRGIMKERWAHLSERRFWHAGNPGLCGQIPGGLQVVRERPAGPRFPWRLWTSSARPARWPQRAALHPAMLRRLEQ